MQRRSETLGDAPVVAVWVSGVMARDAWLPELRRDDPLRPTEGYRLEFNLAGTYENPVSDVSFAQGTTDPNRMYATVQENGDADGNGDWDAGGWYDGTDDLTLEKLKANTINSNPEVTIKVWCMEDCEVYSICVWEIHT